MGDSAIDSDLWHVELSSGEVHVITLDQLDDAFNRGLVNEQTRVWQEGMGGAVSLGELLGAIEDEPVPPATSVASSVPASAAATSAWPPVVSVSIAPPPSSAPTSSPTAWQTNAIPSIRPLALDVGDDFEAFAKPQRRRAPMLALAALVAVGVGVAAYRAGESPSSDVAAATVAPNPTTEPAKSHALDPGDTPLHLREMPPVGPITPPDAPSPDARKPTAEQSEAQRRAALTAANTKLRAHTKAATHRGPARGKVSATGYKGTKGGSKYDPLNGAL